MCFKSRKIRDTDMTMNPGPHSTAMRLVSFVMDVEVWEVDAVVWDVDVVAVVSVMEPVDEEEVVDDVFVSSVALLSDCSAAVVTFMEFGDDDGEEEEEDVVAKDDVIWVVIGVCVRVLIEMVVVDGLGE